MGEGMQDGHMIEEAAPGNDDWADAEGWEDYEDDEDEDLGEDQIRVRDAIAAAERCPEDDVPDEWQNYISINKEFFAS